eukprot:scaffold25536_cov64-Phaeocystis_antarctica.AAC.2
MHGPTQSHSIKGCPRTSCPPCFAPSNFRGALAFGLGARPRSMQAAEVASPSCGDESDRLASTNRELLETRALAQRACGSMRASVTLARERLDALQSAMQAKVAELEAAGTRNRAALEAETARRTRAERDLAELKLEVTAARQRLQGREQMLEAERSGSREASREAEELKAARFAQAQARAKQLLGELQRRLTQQSGTLSRQQEAMTRAQEDHEVLQRQQQAALREAGARLEAQGAMIAKLQAERDGAASLKQDQAVASASREGASRGDASRRTEEEQTLKTQVVALHAALCHALRDGLGSEQAKQLHATSQLLQQGALEMARRNGHLGAQLSDTREQLHLLQGAAEVRAEASAGARGGA